MLYYLINLKELVLYSYGALQDYEAIDKRLEHHPSLETFKLLRAGCW
jgi:hypothetical protein